MSLKITGKEKDTFSFDGSDPTPVGNAMGGTELQMKWLRETVDNDLLDKFQIIPTRVRDLDPDKPKILWVHDTANDPEVAHLRERHNCDVFDKLVFVSHWQKQQFEYFLGLPPSKSVVLRNAIHPIEFHEKPDDQINIIYHTTPHRGLNILLSVFQHLSDKYDNIHLDIYSSFKVYGWDHRDLDYQNLFDMADELPNVTNHGAVSNDEVREALQKAHIFAYPSIWPETSCIAMIEAMSARCVTVAPTFAALPETAANFAWMYPWHENLEAHASMFAATLDSAIHHIKEEQVGRNLNFQKAYFDQFYGWGQRSEEWTGFLRGMASQ
jgi:UDP-glucose:(glucosyl)LPS alpha-1,2-glucosyltransferase